MENCWHVLGLDAATATEKDVKTAYAKLLKVHRPESDPEGFQRTRSAYETALAALRGGAPMAGVPVVTRVEQLTGQTVVAPDVAPTPTPPPAPVQPEMDAAIEGIKRAAAARIRQKVREALAEFDKRAVEFQVPHEVQAQMLVQAFAESANLLSELCGVDRILRHAEAGETGLAHVILKMWRRDGDTKQLQQLAHALLKHRNLAAGEFGATVLVHTAVGLGAWEPDLAEELSRKAFPHLAPDHRAELTAAVDQEIMVGRIFAGFPRDHKVFWLGFVRGTGTRTNWRDSWSRELLSFVLRHCGPKWPGYALLQQTMPPQVWDDMVHAMRMITG